VKAAVINRFGDNSVVRIAAVATPTVGDHDILVRVHAASVNPVDVKTRQGKMQVLLKYRLPLVLGNDVAGVVTQVGARVTRLQPSDAVLARVDADRIGTFAEYVAVSESAAARKPSNISFEEAASLPLVSLTAWQALVEIGRLGPGQRVLVHAGSGGAVVSINSNTPSPDFARAWGLNPVLVFAIRLLSRKVLAAARTRGARFEYCFVRANGAQLERIAELVEQGVLRPVVDRTNPLTAVAAAIAYSESGRATGKVVVQVIATPAAA